MSTLGLNSIAHCEEFAQHFADKIVWICSDLGAPFDADPVDVTLTPACSVTMDTFQSVHPEGVDKTLRE